MFTMVYRQHWFTAALVLVIITIGQSSGKLSEGESVR